MTTRSRTYEALPLRWKVRPCDCTAARGNELVFVSGYGTRVGRAGCGAQTRVIYDVSDPSSGRGRDFSTC